MSRREWLFGTASLLGTGVLSGRLQAEGVPGPQAEYGGFPMGIQSYSLRHLDFDAALDAVEELGLHHVELFGAHLSPASSDAEIHLALKKLRRRDISISAHGVNRFTEDHDANRRVFEFANRAGIRNLSADPSPNEATFDSLERLVDEFGVRIAIHNHGPGHHWATPERLLEGVSGRHKRIGVCADLGHFLRADIDPISAMRTLGDRVYGVHLKDFAERQKDTRGVVIGRGHLDLRAVFSTLHEIDFPADGALSLEYEEPDPMVDIKACLAAAGDAARSAGSA